LFPNSPKHATFGKLKGGRGRGELTLWNLRFKPYVEISSILSTKKNPQCMSESALRWST
jgi:hypothetical protein